MAATQVTTRQIKDAAITTVKILDANVTLIKMALLTKGQLITSNGTANTALSPGTDTFVLTADSSNSLGVKWAAATGLLSTNFVYNETPSGTVNGVNAAFTLANTPTAGTVTVYVNGLRQKVGSGNDYTISTNTITFETAGIPQTGDVLTADYQK